LNNQEGRSIAQNELKIFFNEARALQKEKAKRYGETWQDGRPVGVTDNLFWIVTRLQNMERELQALQADYKKTGLASVGEAMEDLHQKIEDDLLDLANFAGFRWVMNDDKRDMI